MFKERAKNLALIMTTSILFVIINMEAFLVTNNLEYTLGLNYLFQISQ